MQSLCFLGKCDVTACYQGPSTINFYVKVVFSSFFQFCHVIFALISVQKVSIIKSWLTTRALAKIGVTTFKILRRHRGEAERLLHSRIIKCDSNKLWHSFFCNSFLEKKIYFWKHITFCLHCRSEPCSGKVSWYEKLSKHNHWSNLYSICFT